ncbi:Phosphodiester glycosidase [anaerobic digester metagenome]
MAKAVVMQVTDNKNRRQDMNTRQFFFIATDAIRPAWRVIRSLPTTWLAALIVCCTVAMPRPGLAAPDQQGNQQPPGAVLADEGHAPALPAAPPHAMQPADAAAAKGGVDAQGRADWRELEPGLLFGEFQLNEGDARLTVLRIDPASFDFTLCSRSQDGGPSRQLNQWGEQYNLVAAINASMYLPDASTSTGYMRQGSHVNNGRVVQRFGAFFVAGPDEPTLPKAAILDRDNPLWRQQMDHYDLVIQNYRMINADRRILWSPGGPHYSISAVAQDGDGQILFMHCRQPVEAYSFAQQVLHLPLNVRTVMYVEGGGQAGLLVRSAALTRELVGLSPSGLLVTGDLRAVLPNVLGARRKNGEENSDGNPGGAPGGVDARPAAPVETQAPPVSAPAPAANADQTQPVTDTPAQSAQTSPSRQAPSGTTTDVAAPTKPEAASDAETAPTNITMPAHVPAAPEAPKVSPAESVPPDAPLTEPGTSLAPPPSGPESSSLPKGPNK